MDKSIEDLMDEYDCDCVAVVLDSFASTQADGSLEFYDEFTLYGLKDRNGKMVDYAIDHYHTGLQPGCFGVREAYAIPVLSDWNCEKQFYKNISKEYKEGIF